VPASATRDDARGRAFDAALDSGDTATALALVLDAMTGATTDDSGHVRSMLARATAALGDPVDVTGTLRPLVDLLLRLRDQARADKRWTDSDTIRDGLAAAGVEVRDTPDGTTWEARP
jgi:cysteinyl-tRNA synthetase